MVGSCLEFRNPANHPCKFFFSANSSKDYCIFTFLIYSCRKLKFPFSDLKLHFIIMEYVLLSQPNQEVACKNHYFKSLYILLTNLYM